MASGFDRSKEYEVPFSRLFIINGTQGISQDEIKEAFKQYGNVRSVKKVLDRQTKTDHKGWCNVRFSKASEAFLALENMNGVTLPGAPKPLRIVIGHDKGEQEFDSEEPINRILVRIRKDWNKEKVREVFEEYGAIHNVHVLLNKETDEPKGLAFVRFERPYCAAVALEECDSSFGPLFATDKPPASRQPRSKQPPKQQFQDPYGYDSYDPYAGGYGGEWDAGYDDGYGYDEYGAGPDGWGYQGMPARGPSGFRGPPPQAPGGFDYGNGGEYVENSAGPDFSTGPPGYGKDGLVKLEVKPSAPVSRDQLFKLFDIIPGLQSMEIDGEVYRVVFDSPNWADYAKQKYNGLEYPPGHPLNVSFVKSQNPNALMGSVIQELASAAQNPADIQSLVQTLQKAASALSGTDEKPGTKAEEIVRYCDFPLPLKKRPAGSNTKPSAKLFVHSKPGPIPYCVVEDMFCRFEGLHSVAWVPGKNYGFAKFTNEESAKKAIELFNEKTIAGKFVTVKISQPNEKKDGDSGDVDMEEAPDAKRPRV